MRKNIIGLTLAFFSLLIVTIFLFWPFFIKHLIPFPGDYLLAWYEPWKTDSFINHTITIIHKPVADDVFRHLYPLRLLAAEMIKNFQWPLWNPYNGAGMPLLAIMHPGYLNPFGVFFLFLTPELSWFLYIALQPFILGFFTYLYCRQIGLRLLAAIFTAVTLIFSGFVIARLEFGEFIYTLSCLPLLLLIVEISIKKRKSLLLLCTPFIVLFLFLSGQPHMILYVLLFVFLYALFFSRNLLLFGFLIFLGIGLASFQLLPTFELYRLSTINQASSEFIFKRFLVPLTHFVSLFIPNYFGNPSTYNYWGNADYIETVVSLSLIPCFFVMLALLKRKNGNSNLIKFFFISVLVSVALAVNWFGSRWFYSLGIPVLSVDVPSRIFVLSTFSLSILAGYGFNIWLKNKNLVQIILPAKLFVIFILLITSVTALLVFIHFPCRIGVVNNCWTVGLRNSLLEDGFFTLFILIFILKIKTIFPLLERFTPQIVILLIIVLGLYNSNKFLPFSKKETMLPVNDVLHILKEKTKDARVFGLGQANLKTNLSTFFRIYDPNYYDPLHIKRYAQLIYFANIGKILPVLPRSDIEIISEATPSADINYRRNRLFDLLSVKYLLYKKEEFNKNNIMDSRIIWQNTQWILMQRSKFLPKVYLVNSFEIKNNDNQILNRMFDPLFNVSSTVVLEKNPGEIQKNTDAKGEAYVTKYKENEVIIKTSNNAKSILVLTDNYYPGWKAFVDGKNTEIFRANYSFRAVLLPPGKHIVNFVYQSESLKLGIIISALFTILYFILVVLKLKS